MMTKTQFFCLVALLFVTCSLFPTGAYAQTCTLEEKYWAYRKNLNEKFINVDFDSVKDGYHPSDGIGVPRKNPDGSLMMPFRFTKSGTSMPGTYYDGFSNSVIAGGDGTIMLGNYMAMLATEFKLLESGGNSKDAERTLDELFLAIQAYQRLDKEFNYFMLKEGEKQRLDTIKTLITRYKLDPATEEPIIDPITGNYVLDSTIVTAASTTCDSLQMHKGIDTSGFSGLFYRTDIGKDDLIGTTTVRNAQNYNSTFVELQNAYEKDGNKFVPTGTNWASGNQQGNFTSFDQITGLLYGLTMVNKMIGTPVTDKEKEIVKNTNAAIKGLICSGLQRIRLQGCFHGQGFLKGNGFLGGLKEKLLDIAQENGMLEVIGCADKLTIANFLSGEHSDIDYLKRICNNWGLKPYEANHWGRLYAISPKDDNIFKSDFKAYSDHAFKLKKHSFALSAAIFNADNLPDDKVNYLLNDHCSAMMKKLESAPCCGPCVNCSTMIIKDGINIVNNGIPDWYNEDSNAETTPCGEKAETSFPPEKPIFFNGIDYMLSMNLMLLTCEQQIDGKFTFASGNEDKQPKSTKPADLKAIEGCGDEGELHIKGPTEVCAGATVEFTLSSSEWFSPPREDDKTKNDNGAWGINGAETQLGGDASRRHKTTYKVPDNATGTFTISYNWGDKEGTPRTKQVQKTIKIVGKKPDIPKVVSTSENLKTCTYSIVTESGETHSFPLLWYPRTVVLTETNACGSATSNYTIPGKECKEPGGHSRVVQNNTNNINIEILSNIQTNTISVKSEILYNVPFVTQLIDINGRLVKKQEFPNSDIIIDLAPLELQSGLYIFNLSSQDGFSKSQKIYYEHY